ncbi:MAG: hypothetical protein AB1401_07665 [Thermodesulfobacteriota bacterium]
MALGLHQECISRLIDSVAVKLTNVQVIKDIVLDTDSMMDIYDVDEILPTTGEVRDKLNQYVSELPLFDFIYETISRDIGESGTYNPDSEGILLNTLPGYEDLHAVASRLINDFESLPWSYLISLELPNNIRQQLREAVGYHEFDRNFRIVSSDETFDRTYPLRSGNKKRDEQLLGHIHLHPELATHLGYLPNQWNKQGSCLQINTEGFIGHSMKSAPVHEAIANIKKFIGLSLAVRLMKINERPVIHPFGMVLPAVRGLIVHRQLGENWEVWSKYDLPSDLSGVVDRLEIDDLGGRLDREGIKGMIQNKLHIVSTAFKNRKKAKHILLASQWLFDSHLEQNQLLSFVQSMVTMEILLGKQDKADKKDKTDRDRLSIRELLGNRCAYLIGRSHSERKNILKDFNEIYDVRSSIVHRGKNRLSHEERVLFRVLQSMCRRVITEELKLITRDKSNAM